VNYEKAQRQNTDQTVKRFGSKEIAMRAKKVEGGIAVRRGQIKGRKDK
jgi:hypothetical protein